METYLRATRAPWYSFLFALPLLVLYQVAALLANLGSGPGGVINGADALIQNALSVICIHGWVGTSLVLALIIGIFVYRADPTHRKGPVRWSYFPTLLLESAIYAVFFGSIVAFLTRHLLPYGGFLQVGGITWGQKLASGLGAGLYEELVFRLGITGTLLWLLGKAKIKPGPATVVAVLLSSLLFSLFHYVGAYGEPFQLYSFSFRFIAGVVLAMLFAVRGFAVAAWTHSLYDVFLLLFAGR